VLILALVLGALAGLAAFNLGTARLTAQATGGPPHLQPVGSAPPPLTSPSATADPTPAATPTPTPEATPTPAPTPSATPAAGNHGKLIVVSLATQHLTAYQDGAVVLSTVVATGRPALATPKGTFHVMAKYTPYKFVSPWAKGSPYWYPSEWVSYAMLFADDGYFLHDAPWRTVYGPGANTTQGTHGCVNVPTPVMAQLYRWASIGTTVVIQ
jgi:lipoprotein-anchoring transpeptidase ErfK/SrfK